MVETVMEEGAVMEEMVEVAAMVVEEVVVVVEEVVVVVEVVVEEVDLNELFLSKSNQFFSIC
jgi:hypothetical protein